MKREEAIKAIEDNRPRSGYIILNEALDMAITALKNQPVGIPVSEDEIKELIQTELEESGYMYALGMLKGMYKAGAFNAVEWCTLSMYLADLNMERIG